MRNPSSDPAKCVTISLPGSVLARAVREAKQNKESMSAYLRRLLMKKFARKAA